MSELIDQFRAKLSEELESSMAKKDHEAVGTLRGFISAFDQAGVQNEFEIEQLLLREIVDRENAKAEFERLGNLQQAELTGKSIELILSLGKYL